MIALPRASARAALMALGLALAACATGHEAGVPSGAPEGPPASAPPQSLFPAPSLPPSARRLPAEGFVPATGPLRLLYVSTFCLTAMCNPPGWILHLAPDHRAQHSMWAHPPDAMTERWSMRDGGRTLARKDGGTLFIVQPVDER